MEVFQYAGSSRHLKFESAEDMRDFLEEYGSAEDDPDLRKEILRRWFRRGGFDGEVARRPDGST